MDVRRFAGMSEHPEPTLGFCLRVCLLLIVFPVTDLRGQEAPSPLSMPVLPGDSPEGASFRSLMSPAVESKENQLALFDNVFRVQSRQGSARVDRLIPLLEQRHYWRAQTEVNAAIEIEPARKSLYLVRAFLRCMTMKTGDANALAWAEHDLALGKQFPEEAFPAGIRGCIATRQGQYQLAIDPFSWAIERGADFNEFRIRRAYAYMRLRSMEQAIGDLDRVIRRDPGFYEALRYRVYCHTKLGKWEQALDDLDRAIQLRPRETEARMARFELALKQGKYEVILTDLDKLANDLPDSAPLFLFLRPIISWVARKDLHLVKADLDRAIQREPREWSMHAFRAFVNYRQAQYAGALGDLGRSVIAMNHEKFEIRWRYQTLEDKTQRFYLGVHWHIEDRKSRPNDAQAHEDLEHKLVDLGLKALWGSRTSTTRM